MDMVPKRIEERLVTIVFLAGCILKVGIRPEDMIPVVSGTGRIVPAITFCHDTG
jgi:hypothetical protein